MNLISGLLGGGPGMVAPAFASPSLHQCCGSNNGGGMQNQLMQQQLMQQLVLLLLGLLLGQGLGEQNQSSGAGVPDFGNAFGGGPSGGGGAPAAGGGGGARAAGGGAGGGGGGGFNAAGGQAVDPSQFQGGTATGRRLAAAALAESTDGDSPGGWCSRDVQAAMKAAGIPGVKNGDAWKQAENLANNPAFQELQVSRDQLQNLPPGAVVVWDKGPGLPYGHVSIALGDGREASDLLKNQMKLRTNFRVFYPK